MNIDKATSVAFLTNMNPIFKRGVPLSIRLLIAVIIATMMLVADGFYNAFQPIRNVLNTVVAPIQYVASLPNILFEESANRLKTQADLIDERTKFINEIMLLREKEQRFSILEAENQQLRNLLDAPIRLDLPKTVAELMAVDNNPFTQQVVINKGALNGVFTSQPVVDDKGIVGQVVDVAPTNSRVLFITDISHAIPVRVLRNNLRFIINGSGDISQLKLQYVPHSADLEIGDVLISSGLGGVFPEGYPVAVIDTIIRDETRPFARVVATPLARLDSLRYVLLLGASGALDESEAFNE